VSAKSFKTASLIERTPFYLLSRTAAASNRAARYQDEQISQESRLAAAQLLSSGDLAILSTKSS
jgi:hypothetical protein